MSALPEARESLTYWESRLERLPLHAIRKRREAREMATRWRERVCEAERARYGGGMLGALLMLLAERRLPLDTRHSSQRVMRIGLGVAGALAVMATALVVLAITAMIALLVAIF
jgi:hypothetical protein